MKAGMVGLGKMGGNMAARLIREGHEIAGYAHSGEAVAELEKKGGTGAGSLEELVSLVGKRPRVVWLMVPSGGPVDDVLESLAPLLEEGDVVVDGGNSWYRDTIERAGRLKSDGIRLIDVGTSGGVWGLEEGYSMMVGGDEDAVGHIRPLLESLAPAPDRGWGRVGPCGAGHFVKMIHNGIEYGMMQAYAEGFAIMNRKDEFGLDLHAVAEIWRYGSVVRSWLLDLIAASLEKDPSFEGIEAYVADSGEGRWTAKEAIELGVPAPVISMALAARFRSQDKDYFGDRLLAALRNMFGGHETRKK